VGQRSLYALDDLVLELQSEDPSREDVDQLLQELSWGRVKSSSCKPALFLSITRVYRRFSVPRNAREVLHAEGFSGLEAGDDFYLTDGSSLFHLRPGKGQGYARLAPSFFERSPLARANFWCFGLFKLLRPLGIYSLHAGALATLDGAGLLLVGPSGSGKSTLTIGLIRHGWRYLSDDAVFLRHEAQAVKALACRRSFYIDASCSPSYSNFSLAEEEPDGNGRQRRRVGIRQAYPAQYLSQCVPRIIVFPQITYQNRSTLLPMDDVHVLGMLLAQSAPQLFDGATMDGHLALLKRLLQQTESYKLTAGTDLYNDPAKLIGLIEAQGAKNWRG
jgi:hypothetical protein